MLFSRSKSLTPTDAAAALARGELQLIDVREPSELSEARINGARHIPLGQLSAKLGELDRDRPVAFLCRSGSRSAIATRSATKAGLDAANVKGGITAWTRAGTAHELSAIAERSMIFRQLIHDDLGCASYLIGDDDAGVAAVVDPKFEIEEYLALARYMGVRIEHVLETHNHADHVSGHGRLAAATGAKIHIHRLATPDYEHEPFDDGWELQLGTVTVRALHTPGHRPEHTAYALIDTARGPEPWAVLSGDTLFVGDIARPDLAVEKREGASGIFHSLHDTLLTLPAECEVWPGHLGGSLCGGPEMDMKISSTIAYEHAHNELLQIGDEDEFVHATTSTLGPQPPNFQAIVALNRGPLVTAAVETQPLTPRQVEQRQGERALIVDVRTDLQFDDAHIPDAVCNPAVRAGFGTKLAWVADRDREVVLVGRDDADATPRRAPRSSGRDPQHRRVPRRRHHQLARGEAADPIARADRRHGAARAPRRATGTRRTRALRVGPRPHPRVDPYAVSRHRRDSRGHRPRSADRDRLLLRTAQRGRRVAAIAPRRPSGHSRRRRRRRDLGEARLADRRTEPAHRERPVARRWYSSRSHSGWRSGSRSGCWAAAAPCSPSRSSSTSSVRACTRRPPHHSSS